MKGLVAGLLSAFMVLGAVAVAPMGLQANDLPVPNISVDTDDVLTWNAVGAPEGAQITIIANHATTILGATTALTGSINLRQHFTTGTHNIQVQVSYGAETRTNSINWTPTFENSNQLVAPPNPRVDASNVLRWDTVANATSYRITWGNHQIDVIQNHWNIDFSLFTQGQSVTFSIVAMAQGLTPSAAATVTWVVTDATMPTPTISITPAGLLTWTGAGAQIVRLYRNNSAIWTSEAAITQIDLTDHTQVIGIGDQNIQIRFLNANGTPASNLSNTAVVNLTGLLPAPTGVAITGNTLSWTAVPNAVGYRVYVGGTQRTTQNITGTEFNLATLNLSNADHNIQVRAMGNSTTTRNSPLSTGINFRPGAVGTPTNVNIAGTNLSWTAVSNAIGYRIYVGGTARTTGTEITATNFNLATLNLAIGTHEVQVRALGNNTNTFDSALSTAVNFEVTIITLDAPANAHLRDTTVLHWDAVPGTRGYTIYVGGAVRSAPTTATHFALGTLSLAAGEHSIQIRALGNNETTLDSPLSTPVTFTVGATLPPGELPSLWAQEMVTTAVNAGLVPQQLRINFTQATTRAEFAALSVALYETVMGYTIMGRMQFNDTIDVNVQKMGYLGVVLGVGGGNFAPNDPLTREQAATMLARLADAIGQPLPMTPAAFPDNSAIAPWAIVQVGQMQGAGIMVGADGGMFMPQGPYTREQSIVTLLRLFDIVR